MGASLPEWTFQTLKTNSDLALVLSLEEISAKWRAITHHWKVVKWALFIICLRSPVPECLLVEEILVAAVPDVIII